MLNIERNGFDYINVDEWRIRLRDMTDAKVIEFGKACQNLLRTRLKTQSEEPWKTQLELAKDEWKRRYPTSN
jgi:hypothetical protein